MEPIDADGRFRIDNLAPGRDLYLAGEGPNGPRPLRPRQDGAGAVQAVRAGPQPEARAGPGRSTWARSTRRLAKPSRPLSNRPPSSTIRARSPLATSPSPAGSSTWKAGPFAGVTVQVDSTSKAKGGDLSPWLEAVRRGEPPWVAYRHLEEDKEKPSGKAETDAQGRFRIEGLGAEKVVTLSIEGPTIAHTHVDVVTRRVEPFPATGFPNTLWSGDPDDLRGRFHLHGRAGPGRRRRRPRCQGQEGR